MRFLRGLVTAVVGVMLAGGIVGADEPARPADAAERTPFEPTSHYARRELRGWTLRVHQSLEAEADLWARTREVLDGQLFQIERNVPAVAVERLRTVPVWIELVEPHHPCMCYHPGAGWLRDHGMNPEKEGGVEIANARNFIAWTRDQPWMVLHEMAHAYHHQFLADGFENAPVQTAFDSARTAGRYSTVLRISGRHEKAYAATNPMEYFAECSEAFFGTNDFFPFVRAELKEHDPEMFERLGELWNHPQERRPRSDKPAVE